MALTIPTPEGPFEAITFLGDRMDWQAWLDDVTTISRALNIWDYVNPDGSDHLSEPVPPTIPSRPRLKVFPGREQYETDKVFDLRVEQERHAHSLALREYDILGEQYRMDTTQYLSILARYTAAKDDLQKLYRIIYRSIPDRYRAYLRLDGAETPRNMVQCLRSRIQPPSDKERAPIAQRQFDMKLNVQPTDDKQDFIEAIAMAAVELQRLKASTFDEATAVKDLIQSLQTLDKPFADAWTRKFDGGSGRAASTVLQIVEEFKYKMRMQDDRPYFKGLSDAAASPAPVSASTSNFEEPEPETFASQPDEPFDLPIQNHPAKTNGFDSAKTPKKAKKVREDAPLAELQPKAKRADREVSFIDKSSKSKSTVVPDFPPSEKHSKSKKRGESNGSLAMQICPGCQLRHLIRGDAWWESCFVYYELSGLGNVPEHFVVSARKLDLAYSRLEDFPDEYQRAEEWVKKKKGNENGAKELAVAEFNLW